MAPRKSARLGRPPASSAADRRERILDVACELFSTRGYGVTTNKDVAAEAGITSGALYYYFDSKLAMYLAVFEHLQTQINERFSAAAGGHQTFDGKIRAILEASYAMNVENPSLARFQGAARADRSRHPELQEAIANAPGEGATLVPDLVAVGIETGEIQPERAGQVAAVLRTMFVGLVDAMSQNPSEHRNAIDGILALLDGKLLKAPRRTRRSR
jgi:AcrR family transcriptional regulator